VADKAELTDKQRPDLSGFGAAMKKIAKLTLDDKIAADQLRGRD
jgi:hypothetical protein